MVADVAIGLAAGVLAFAEAALAASKGLYNQFLSIRTHKDVVNRFLAELQSLDLILNGLRERTQGPLTEQSQARLGHIQIPLQDVKRTCDALSAAMTTCKAGADEGVGAWFKKWLKLQYRGKSMKDSVEDLGRYKDTLSIALQIAALNDHDFTEEQLADLKNLIQERLDDVPDELDRVKELILTYAEAGVEELRSHAEALKEIQQLLEEALEAAATAEPRTLELRSNVADDGSGQYLGADSGAPFRSIVTTENKATGNSMQIIGQYTPETIQRMISSRPAQAIRATRVPAFPSGVFDVRFLNTPREQSRSASGEDEPNIRGTTQPGTHQEIRLLKHEQERPNDLYTADLGQPQEAHQQKEALGRAPTSCGEIASSKQRD